MPPAPWSPRPRIALVVGGHDEADVRLEPRCASTLGDAADVVGRDPRPRGAPQDVAELLAGPADGRRVDDRHELLEVLEEHAVEERLVAVLQRGQADVALEVVALAADVLELQVTCSSIVRSARARARAGRAHRARRR